MQKARCKNSTATHPRNCKSKHLSSRLCNYRAQKTLSALPLHSNSFSSPPFVLFLIKYHIVIIPVLRPISFSLSFFLSFFLRPKTRLSTIFLRLTLCPVKIFSLSPAFVFRRRILFSTLSNVQFVLFFFPALLWDELNLFTWCWRFVTELGNHLRIFHHRSFFYGFPPLIIPVFL